MAEVNLWELVTCVASRDLPNSEECKLVKELAAVGAMRNGQELSLEVLPDCWIIRIFDCDRGLTGGPFVVLQVFKHGTIVLERTVRHGDMTTTRILRIPGPNSVG